MNLHVCAEAAGGDGDAGRSTRFDEMIEQLLGPPGPILSYILHGSDKGTTVQLADATNVTDVAEASDGAGWALSGRSLYRQTPDGTEVREQGTAA